jgi:hypothetical protein
MKHHDWRQELDHLTNEMGEMRIEQGATLNLVQQNAQLIQAIQEEEAHRWMPSGNFTRHHIHHQVSEQEISFGEVPLPTKVSIYFLAFAFS